MMKYILGIIILYVLISLDWNGIFQRKDKIKDFIPGTYVFFYKNDMSTISDTLTITKMKDNSFTVRKKGFEHYLNPAYQIFDRHDSAFYGAFYDVSKKILIDQSAFPLFSFDPDKNCLHYDSSEFKKIEK